MERKAISARVVAAACCLFCNLVYAQSVSFDRNTALTTAANYSDSSLPTAAKDVLVKTTNPSLVISSGSVTMRSLTIANGLAYTLTNASIGSTTRTLTIGNAAGFTNGYSGGTNDLLSIANRSSLDFSGLNMAGGTAVTNLILAGSGNLSVAGGSALKIGAAGGGGIGGPYRLTKTGAGTLTLAGINSFSGGLTIAEGNLICGAVNTIPGAGTLTLSGGVLTTGATNGYSQSAGALLLSGHSSMALGTGSHVVQFAASDGQAWAPGKVLTVTGWTGTPGSAGTGGRVFVGTNSSGLTATQLSQVVFAGYPGNAVLLSTGEMVPPAYVGGGNVGAPGVNWLAANSGYSLPVNCTGGDFRVLNYRRVSMAAGTPADGRGQWYTSVNVRPSGGDVPTRVMSGGAGNGFFFSNGGACGAPATVANRWDFSAPGAATLDAVSPLHFGQTGGSEIGIDMGTPGYYTFVMKDVTSAGTAAFYAGYTSNPPVSILHNAAAGQLSACYAAPVVSASLSAVPSPGEKFFLRYRAGTPDFSGATSVVEGTVSGTSVTFSLPPLQQGTVYYYYLLSTTHPSYAALGEEDKSLAVLAFADNGGANYSLLPTGPSNVIAPTLTGGNGQLTVNWANPADCYDDILVVATDAPGGVTTVPAGDGSSYTASPLYNDGTNNAGLPPNEYAVYRGSGTSVDVTGLLNGVTYYLKIFTRKGTFWSAGSVLSGSPANAFNGAFRSRQDGAWSSPSTWEIYNGGSWMAASTYPNSATTDVTVRHSVTLDLSARVTRNLQVDAGAKLSTNTANGNNKYLTVYGNLSVAGTIGNGPAGDDIAFNIEGPSAVISGTGSFYCSRLRKHVTAATTNLLIDMNMATTFSGAQIFNDYSGTSAFNLTLAAGRTLSCLNGGSVSIDGTNPATGYSYAWGKYTINGTLSVSGTLYMFTNNKGAYKCEVEIGPAGTISAAAVNASASDAATHMFRIGPGGRLVLAGAAAFAAFSTFNNSYDLQPGSVVEYNAAAPQAVESGLGYSDLRLSGAGTKTAGGTLTVSHTLTLDNVALALNGSLAGGGVVVGSPASALLFAGGGSSVLAMGQGADGSSNALGTLSVEGSTVTLANKLHLYEILSIGPGGSLACAGQPLVLKSTAAGTARVTEIKGTLTGATAVTVERYIPALAVGRRWRLLTAPLTGSSIAAWQEGSTWAGAAGLPSTGYGTLITGGGTFTSAAAANAAGFDWWPALSANAQASVRRYRGAPVHTAATWEALPTTRDPAAFDNAGAYLLFVRGDRSFSTGTAAGATTLRATGTLRQGPVMVALPGSAVQSHVLVGNPFAAPLDFYALYTDNAALIKDRFWLFNASFGTGASLGTYQLVIPSGTPGSYEALPAPFGPATNAVENRLIHSGSAFFVEPATTGGGTLAVREAHKAAAVPGVPVFRATKAAQAKQ